MNRKDREMDKEFGLGIIDDSKFGVVSVIDGDEPYGIPLSIARIGEMLYFHSAKDGKKARAFAKNNRVSVAFVGRAEVPEIFTNQELDELLRDKTKVGILGTKVFTTEFESAIVEGELELVDDEEEKIQAFRSICEKYTPAKMDYFDLAMGHDYSRANIYRIKIKEIKAKRKKFDKHGEEMKWAKLE